MSVEFVLSDEYVLPEDTVLSAVLAGDDVLPGETVVSVDVVIPTDDVVCAEVLSRVVLVVEDPADRELSLTPCWGSTTLRGGTCGTKV